MDVFGATNRTEQAQDLKRDLTSALGGPEGLGFEQKYFMIYKYKHDKAVRST